MPEPGKQCPSKRRYPSQLIAFQALAAMRQKGRNEKRVYRCNHCRGWHTTRRPRRWPEGQWHMGLA